MENALVEDLPTGIYHTSDKIKNLKIKITVKKIANACFTEKDPLVFGNPNELELVNIMKAPSAKAEQVFLWQEKIEINHDELDSNRKREIETSKKDSLVISLFSYIDSDIISENWKRRPHTVPISQSNHLENQITKSKPKPRLQFHDMETWQKPLFSGTKILVKEKRSTKEVTFPSCRSMIIMAVLQFDDSSSNEEIQLCFLQVDDNGTLVVMPDFTKQKSYIFLNSRSETFEYEIENLSPVLKESAIEREKYLMKKIALYKNKIKTDNFGLEFIRAESEAPITSINCEIVSAKNFSYPDIFVHYTVLLPKGWHSESDLEGVTETCRCKVLDDVNVAYYGYLFSLDLIENTIAQESEVESKENSVKIIFEVTSVDFWGNFRNEGYGYANIMLTPGTEVNHIHTWKIEPITLKSKLQYFFIGGMPTLSDLSYVVKPKNTKDSQLSKYGLRTITSGSLKFRSCVITQNYTAEIT